MNKKEKKSIKRKRKLKERGTREIRCKIPEEYHAQLDSLLSDPDYKDRVKVRPDGRKELKLRPDEVEITVADEGDDDSFEELEALEWLNKQPRDQWVDVKEGMATFKTNRLAEALLGQGFSPQAVHSVIREITDTLQEEAEKVGRFGGIVY